MKWVWRLVAAVVALAVLSLGLLFIVPTDRIAAIAAERFEEATGRKLDLDEGVRASLWPVLGVRTGAVRLGNSDWAGPEPLFEAESVAIGIDPTTIFGDLRVTRIDVVNPVIRLAVDAEGRRNWDFAGPGGGASGGGSGGGALPTLDAVKLDGGTLFFDAADGTSLRLDDVDIVAGFPDPEGPLTLTAAGRSADARFEAQAKIERFAAFILGGPVPVEASLTSGQSSAGITGTAGLAPLVVDADLSANLKDLAGLFRQFGLEAPDLPRGLGRDEISLRANAGLSDAVLTFDALDVTLDQNTLRGRAEVALGGPRPRVDADLALAGFDLSHLATGGGTRTDADGATTGWSKEQIDMSALGRIDGRIAVTATGLKVGTSTIDALSTVTTIEDARAATEIGTLLAYGGTASGSLVLNARDGFSTRLAVAGSAFAISRLLAELVDYDRIVAAGDLRLNVLGVGRTMDAVMNSLDGDGSFRVGAGELMGLDIVGLLRNLDPSYLGSGHTTIFDEITGSFRIVDGVVINDDLRLTAPLFRATGSGQIGIGAQSLDLRVVPELLGGENAGLKVPLHVTGTWEKPKVRIDLESVLQSKVEDEVRGRVEKEIQDRVGDSLEDALKKGLGGLLQR